MLFSTKVPNAAHTLSSVSVASGTVSPALSMNFALPCAVPLEMPSTCVPSSSNAAFSRLKSCASVVQPDVSSLG